MPPIQNSALDIAQPLLQAQEILRPALSGAKLQNVWILSAVFAVGGFLGFMFYDHFGDEYRRSQAPASKKYATFANCLSIIGAFFALLTAVYGVVNQEQYENTYSMRFNAAISLSSTLLAQGGEAQKPVALPSNYDEAYSLVDRANQLVDLSLEQAKGPALRAMLQEAHIEEPVSALKSLNTHVDTLLVTKLLLIALGAGALGLAITCRIVWTIRAVFRDKATGQL